MENTQEKYPNLISAEILADSLNQFGERITTMKLIFPRIILAEFNTHRMFNRNSASSRAIPFHKMVKMVQEQPFIPIAWQKDHKGMQGSEYLDTLKSHIAKEHWLKARDNAILEATLMNRYQVTKQLCNRLLEPFMYHTVLVTATEWENFFELRCPKYHKPYETIYYRSKKDLLNSLPDVDAKIIKKESTNIDWLQRNKGAAEIHIMDLAEKMWDIYNESTPKQLEAGEWHIPFGDNIDSTKIMEITPKPKVIIHPEEDTSYLESEWYSDVYDNIIKIATARCARISYETLGDNPVIDYEKDIKLHDDLLVMKHMSPFEHCAKAMTEEEYIGYRRKDSEYGHSIYPIQTKKYGWSRNLKGFRQYREIIE